MTTSPDFRFITRRPEYFFAFGMGSGLSPFAPGTVGTLAAFPLYWLLAMLHLDLAAYLSMTGGLFLIGVWFCEKTSRALGIADYGGIVWDEIVAFLLILYFVPQTPLWFTAAFFLFRLFDVWKPFPIRYFDTNIKNGFGVMLDDLLAAGYTLAVVQGWLRL